MFKLMKLKSMTLIGAVIVIITAGNTEATPLDVTWTGAAGGGLYNTPGNWDFNIVPLNPPDFNAIIPEGHTVTYDIPDPQEISQLTLGYSTFNIIAGSLNAYAADITGVISVDDASFVSADTTITGTRARFHVANGGLLVLEGLTTYDTTGLVGGNILSSVDTDSSLDISAVTSLDAGFHYGSGAQYQLITANNGGSINLSGLESTNSPVYSDDYLMFEVAGSDSSIALSVLQTIDTQGGYTKFNIKDGATLDLTSLQTANNGRFHAIDDSSIDLPSLQTASNAMFSANNGSTLTANGSNPVAYNTSGLIGGTIISSVDSGTVVDLSAITSLDAGFHYGSGAQYQHINASNEGNIDLSGLQSTDSPVYSDDYLKISVDGSSASIDLSGLQTVHTSGGYTSFNVFNGATLDLPSLQIVNKGYFYAYSGSTINVNGSQPVAIDNSGQVGGWMILAEGTDAKADLSAVTSYNAGFHYGSGAQYQYIYTHSGGSIDLSGLQSTQSPIYSDDYLRFRIGDSNSSLDLSGLQTINTNGGYTKFDIEGGATLDLTSLQTANNGRFYAIDGSSIDLPSLQIASNAIFSANNGSTLTANSSNPVAYNTSGLIGGTIISSVDSGTVVDLSAITNLDAGFHYGSGAQYQLVIASSGGMIDLSGLQSTDSPVYSDDYLKVSVADTGSSIDMTGLEKVMRSRSGYTIFEASDHGVLNLGYLRGYNNGQFSRLTVSTQATATAKSIDAQSGARITLTEGNLDVENNLYLRASSTMTLDETSRVNIGGHFIFHGSDETKLVVSDATLQFDGSEPQIMEVGGLGIGVNNGRFDLGNLIVGSDSETSTLHLMDLVDNGDRIIMYEGLHINGDLTIHSGSTLVLNDIPLYIDGVQIVLPDGVNSMSYGDGQIMRSITAAAGDVNFDGVIDGDDIDVMAMAANSASAHGFCDLTGDGTMDDMDHAYLIEDILGTYYADFNLDGMVSLLDLNVLGLNYRYTSGMGWADGDCNGDGEVGLLDLDCLGANWRAGMAMSLDQVGSVPEPASLFVLGITGMLLSKRC